MTEKQLREEAIESIRSKVCGERLKEYGSVESNFGRISDLWNVWLKAKNVKLGPEDVAAMMILMKVARLIENPFHLDSAIDAGGYAVCLSVLARSAEMKCDEIEQLTKDLNGIAPAFQQCETWHENPYRRCVLENGHKGDHDFVGPVPFADYAGKWDFKVDHGDEELKRNSCVGQCVEKPEPFTGKPLSTETLAAETL